MHYSGWDEDGDTTLPQQQQHQHLPTVSTYDNDDTLASAAIASNTSSLPRSTSKLKQRKKKHEASSQREQQIVSYTLWINSQLKKKAGQRQVYNFNDDMRDGVAFAQLIATLSGESLPGVDNTPQTMEAYQNNVERVLQFMAAKRIQMHRTVAKDIVEGNIKAIMRLVLAIAAHYKPHSVKQSSYNARSAAYHASTLDRYSSVTTTNDSQTSDRSSRRQQLSADAYLSPSSVPELSRNGLSTDSVPSSDTSGRRRSKSPTRKKVQISPAIKSPKKKSSDKNDSSGDEDRSARVQHEYVAASVHQTSPVHSKQKVKNHEHSQNSTLDKQMKDQLILEHSVIQDELKSTKGLLCELQNVLEVETNANVNTYKNTSTDDYYRSEILTYRKHIIDLQGALSGLRNRLSEQQESNYNLKKQLLDAELESQKLKIEKANLISLQTQQQSPDSTEHVRRENELSKTTDNHFTDIDSKVQLIAATEIDRSNSALRQKIRYVYLTLQEHAACEGLIDTSAVKLLIDGLVQSIIVEDENREKIKNQGQASEARELEIFTNSEYELEQDNVQEKYEIKDDDTGNSFQTEQSSSSDRVTKVLYFFEGETHPSTFLIHKRLGQITFGDFKKIFNLSGPHHFYFKALDPEFGTVKKEFFDEDDILPGWEGKIMAWIEEEVTV